MLFSFEYDIILGLILPLTTDVLKKCSVLFIYIQYETRLGNAHFHVPVLPALMAGNTDTHLTNQTNTLEEQYFGISKF